MIWQKYANERLLVAVDWSSALDGATVVGNATVSPIGSGGLSAEFAEQDDSLTKLWIEGGTAGVAARVSVLVTTSEGENLEVRVSVTVLE